MGALIAFELARALRRAGRPDPTCLIVSGCRAPQLERERDAIHQLPSEQFLAEIRALDGTPDGVLDHPELRALLLPVLRADFALCETYRYRPGPPLTCPVIAYGGLHDAHVSTGALAAWQSQSVGPFGVRLFPGNHFFFRRDTHRVLRALEEDLHHGRRAWTWQMS
jgi:medium-chain acyl-[acyl-carrier-protein] hydrolase